MHRSRFAGFIVDCRTQALDQAADFWSQALGMKNLGMHEELYVRLDGSSRGLNVEVQKVAHESRVHLDIETDDVEAEALRLEKLGAQRVEKRRTWWVMRAPTGQSFCIVPADNLEDAAGVSTWP